MTAVLVQRVLLVVLVLLNLLDSPAWAQQAVTGLSITIVEGEGAINNVRERVNREPIVQVEDENHKPVAGAVVVFFLPNQGATGAFANGTKSLTVTTNAEGKATAAAIKRNNVSGQMQIRVTASFAGQTASAIITQTNVAAASPSGGMSTTAKVLIIVGIAGGAAVGGVLATR